MKYRVGIWAIAGFLVAGFWAVYAIASRPLTYSDPVMALVQFTCPIAFLRSYPLQLSWVLLANAATYALGGVMVETLRRRLHPAR
jgi:hypothetical protein